MSKEITFPTLPKQQTTGGDPGLHLVSQKKYSSGQQSASDGGSKGLVLQILLKFLEDWVGTESG